MSYHDRRDIALKNARIKFGWAMDELDTAIKCAEAMGDDTFAAMLTKAKGTAETGFEPVLDHLDWLVSNGR